MDFLNCMFILLKVCFRSGYREQFPLHKSAMSCLLGALWFNSNYGDGAFRAIEMVTSSFVISVLVYIILHNLLVF